MSQCEGAVLPDHDTSGLKLLAPDAKELASACLLVTVLEESEEEKEGNDKECGAVEQGEEPVSPMHVAVMKATANFPAALIWTCRRGHIDFQSLLPWQLVNHFQSNSCLTTKVGLYKTLQCVYWHSSGSSESFFPRCFYITDVDDLMAFVQDFRLTAAIAVLKQRQAWDVPLSICQLALKAGQAVLHAKSDDSLETQTDELSDVEWETVLRFLYEKLHCASAALDTSAYNTDECDPEGDDVAFDNDAGDDHNDDAGDVVGKNGLQDVQRNVQRRSAALRQSAVCDAVQRLTSPTLQSAAGEKLRDAMNRAESSQRLDADVAQTLLELREVCPQIDMSGVRNVWVIKPAALSRGRGIFCENRLDFILPILVEGSICDRWVAQKYLEAPLLINNTKFDIRQWVVVTGWNPLVIWMYKKSYLRSGRMNSPFS